MRGSAVFLIGLVTVLLALGSIAFIMWSITDYSERCKTEQLDICDFYEGPGLSVMIIIIVIAGLIFTTSTVLYILVTAQ